jgi:hypothetical protein
MIRGETDTQGVAVTQGEAATAVIAAAVAVAGMTSKTGGIRTATAVKMIIVAVAMTIVMTAGMSMEERRLTVQFWKYVKVVSMKWIMGIHQAKPVPNLVSMLGVPIHLQKESDIRYLT